MYIGIKYYVLLCSQTDGKSLGLTRAATPGEKKAEVSGTSTLTGQDIQFFLQAFIIREHYHLCM